MTAPFWTEIGVQIDTSDSSPERAVNDAKIKLPSSLKKKCGIMEARLSDDNKTVAFRLTCKTPLGEDIAVAKTIGLKVATDDFLIKDMLKRTGKAQKMKFFASGWVQESVGAEIEAKSAEEALRFVIKNRHGNQDIPWDYDSWESGVHAVQIMDNDNVEFPLTEEIP